MSATTQQPAPESISANGAGARAAGTYGAFIKDLFYFQPPPRLALDLDKLAAPSVDLWADSPERQWYTDRRRSVFKWLLLAVVLGGVAAFLLRPDGGTPNQSYTGIILAAATGGLAVWCTVPYWAARRAFIERRAKIAAFRADTALHTLGQMSAAGGNGNTGNGNSGNGNSGNGQLGTSPIDMPLHTLFKLNRRQLDAYQELTRRQQRNAFHLTQAASVVGLAVLVTGIVLTFQNDPSANDYVIGGLTGLGALLSAFLGHTFYRTHRDANAQLNWYYVEPYATGRLLIAERLVQVLCLDDRQKADQATTMINALLSWELPRFEGGGSKANGDPEAADRPT